MTKPNNPFSPAPLSPEPNVGQSQSMIAAPVTSHGNTPAPNPTFRDLAEALRNADMASLPVDARDDVIAIMTHLRGHLVARFDALEQWQRELTRREDTLNKIATAREERLSRQEKELAQGLQALNLASVDEREIPHG